MWGHKLCCLWRDEPSGYGNLSLQVYLWGWKVGQDLWLTALPVARASCSFWSLTSFRRWLHADLGGLLLLPVLWQQRVRDDRLAVPLLWDQHRCLECSGRDHGGAVSHQPEVSSSLGSSLPLIWTWARNLPALWSCTMVTLIFLEIRGLSILGFWVSPVWEPAQTWKWVA